MHLVIADVHGIMTQIWNDKRLYTQADPDLNGFFKLVLNATVKEMRRQDHTHACIVWPDYSTSLRRKRDPMYDFDRLVLPRHALPLMQKLSRRFRDLGYKVVCQAGVEAFDVMAKMAQGIEGRDGCAATLITNDDRCWGLVSDQVSVRFGVSDSATNVWMTPSRFEVLYGEMGITPDQYLSFKVLADLEGIGPKKAAGLLREYKDLKTISESMETIDGRTGKSLRANLKGIGVRYYRRYFPLNIETLGIKMADLAVERPAEVA